MPLKVTNHALLRYLERRLGLDVEALRRELLPTDARILSAIDQLGSGTFPVDDSHRVVVKQNTIITVLPFD